MNGTKFWGVPKGNSPILDESCAPIGLKYLSAIDFKLDTLRESIGNTMTVFVDNY